MGEQHIQGCTQQGKFVAGEIFSREGRIGMKDIFLQEDTQQKEIISS